MRLFHLLWAIHLSTHVEHTDIHWADFRKNYSNFLFFLPMKIVLKELITNSCLKANLNLFLESALDA